MYNNHELILATDLDGTLLEGDHQTKNILYNQLFRLRERILLIYVTGRPVETVKQFCKEGYLPSPHFIIGDHGTHIVDGDHFHTVDYLQNPIIQKWNNGNDLIKALLRDEIGLQLQPLNPPYRVAYYYDENHLQHKTLEKIQNAGFDVILSCDMYLDILPRGVNKGSTLLNLLDYLGIDNELAVTCGDSLNDLSLFQTGLKSIAVGNSEPKLIDVIKKLNNVYHSQFPGLLGIIDGLGFFEKMQLLDLNVAA
ncbi:MAG: HAD-IIB family hydrolase [Gammaproteobacteria bacterium]|nr:HAD-IIB family hydrolase [Gammaproteobacteria bacterium]